MAKTVDVAAGQKVASTWGNEVRDRTRQVMASNAERDAWTTAPEGSLVITTDTHTCWERMSGTWVYAGPAVAGARATALLQAPATTFPIVKADSVSVTTNGAGIGSVNWTPPFPTNCATVVVTPGNTSIADLILTISSKSAAAFSVFAVHSVTGNGIANSLMVINYVAFGW